MGDLVLVARELNGHVVQQRRNDGYVNATALCKAAGKDLHDYLRLKSTVAFIAELSTVPGIPGTGVMEIRQGGTPDEQGTWVHPHLSINLAQWCSPRFAVQVSAWVEERLTRGRVVLVESTGDPILDSLAVITQTRKDQLELQRRLEETEGAVIALGEWVGTVNARAGAAGKLADAAMKRADGNHGYLSILGHYKKHGREVSTAMASAHGKRLVRICEQRGVPVQRVHDGRFGSVNLYPESVLEEYFDAVWANEVGVTHATSGGRVRLPPPVPPHGRVRTRCCGVELRSHRREGPNPKFVYGCRSSTVCLRIRFRHRRHRKHLSELIL